MKEIVVRIKKDIMDYWVGIVAAVCYYYITKLLFRAFCPMILVSGLPCPGCGMTRAVFLLLTGQWERSWNLQPMAALWVLFVLYCFIRRYVMGKKIAGFYIICITLFVLLFLYYLFRMATVFPSYPPMVYRRSNFLANNLYFYEDLLRFLFRM